MVPIANGATPTGWPNPFQKTINVEASKSRCVGEAEFAAVYAAADFSAKYEMWMDTMVTISWSRLGVMGDQAVQSAFTTFTKCMRDWLQQRVIPVAYIYAHEVGPVVGLHTHVSVFVAGERNREEFRSWAKQWGERFYGHYISRAVHVSGPRADKPWLHWLRFGYLMKGYDRDCIVQSCRVAPDGRDVRLGDIVPFAWSDPGPVTLQHRVGVSRSLGPERRAIGIPARVDDRIDGRKPHLVAVKGFGMRPVNWSHVLKPFRSKYEDGARDVRVLYGQEFVERVTGLPAGITAPIDNQDDDLSWIDKLII